MYFKYLLTNVMLLFMLSACGGGTTSPTETSSNNNDTNTSDTTDKTTPLEDVNLTVTNSLFKEINVGFGASGSFSFMGDDGDVVWLSSIDLILDDNVEESNEYQAIKNFDIVQFDTLQQYLKNTKFVGYWFTKNWSEEWFNITKIQNLMDSGYIPVFNYWYFGDVLGGGFPTEEEITAYHLNNAKLASFLSKLNGQFLIIMEPEFNKSVVTDAPSNQHEFATIIADAIDIIKKENSQALFSLCMTDKGRRDASSSDPKCGYENCALGDVNEWHLPEIVYNDLSEKLDFISFQEMVGQFHRDPHDSGSWSNPIPTSSTDIETGIAFLAQRISNFSNFLRNKYNKPVFLPFIGIPTATWEDDNNDNEIQESELDLDGWETQASKVYEDLMQMQDELLANNLFGFLAMSLFDDPQNDINGYQYFMDNEYHMGIVKSSAQDEVDKYRFGDIVFKGTTIEALFAKKKISDEENTTIGEQNTSIEEVLTPLKDINLTLTNPLYKILGVGFGGSGSFSFMGEDNTTKWLSSIDLILDNSIEDNSYYQEIKFFDKTQFDKLQQHLSKSKYIVYWMTKGWQPDWFNLSKIQTLIDNGYTPVFNYHYFSDNLGSNMPTNEEIEAYHSDNIALGNFLDELNGTKLVIMEPEFNKALITDASEHQHEFATIISNAIDKIKLHSNSDVLFSLCMEDRGRRDAENNAIDCGYDNCALGDQKAWLLPKIVYADLLTKLDFISFQERIGQFHRNPDNKGSWDNPIPIANTDNSSGIAFLAQRISNFAQFLRNTYKKPIFLPYMSIATASWQDSNQNASIESNEIDLAGWETQAGRVYRDLMLNKAELIKHNLFGIATFSLFDNPQNGIGEYQYFMNNEYHLGIIKSSAKDEIDAYRLGDIQFKSDIITSLFGDI